MRIECEDSDAMTDAPTSPCTLCGSTLPSLAGNPRWRLVRFADPCPVVGWTMLVSRHHRAGPWELSDEESAEFGAIVAAVSRATREATGCERVSLLSFNEAVPHMHLHLVPRHAATAETAGWAVADLARAVIRGERPGVATADADAAAARIAAIACAELRALGFAAAGDPAAG
jgi:diadenosine tetraphosphate (Ap4A) HIT family hydrolase